MMIPSGFKEFPLAHVAIATASAESSAAVFAALGFEISPPEIVARENVRVVLAVKGALRVEFVEPHPAGTGPIAKFIEKRGAGLHHVALYSDALRADLEKLAQRGILPLKGYPAAGQGGCEVAFLDPKTCAGVLIELVGR